MIKVKWIIGSGRSHEWTGKFYSGWNILSRFGANVYLSIKNPPELPRSTTIALGKYGIGAVALEPAGRVANSTPGKNMATFHKMNPVRWDIVFAP